MLQLTALAGPLLEFGARYIVWLYMPALLCFLIAYHFFKDSFLVLSSRTDLAFNLRWQLARRLAFQGLLGLVAGPVVLLTIYYRKELYQCIAGLF